MASTIPNGDYLSRFPYPNYDYQTPFYNYYGDHILPCSPSSNGKSIEYLIVFCLIIKVD